MHIKYNYNLAISAAIRSDLNSMTHAANFDMYRLKVLVSSVLHN